MEQLSESSKTTPSTTASPKVTLWSLLKWNSDSSTIPVVSNSGNKSLSNVQEQRFQTVKYKIYTLITISVLILLYGPVTDAFQNTWDKYQETKTLTQTINKRIDDQKDYQITTEFIKKIEDNKSNIIVCLNQETGCESLPEEIINNKESVKGYIQIGDLQKMKMNINESKILKSINEFMTRSSNSLPNERKYNGNVTDINIGDNESLNNNIIQVPIHLTITFNTQDNLIDFLNNLENRVFYDQVDGLNNSILYKIQEIKYDIVNYRDTQDVEVLLYAYAYNK